MTTVTFVSKLSTARNVERSRIWLQGKRLAACHFTVGRAFVKRWSKGKLTLYAAMVASDDDETGTVSGKGDLPIIDIVGHRVRETFPDATHVKVRFDSEREMITITAAEA